jgi:hypothetical protein
VSFFQVGTIFHTEVTRMRFIIPILLVLAMMLGLTTCGTVPSMNNLKSATKEVSDIFDNIISDGGDTSGSLLQDAATDEHSDVNWADMAYTHYNSDEFYGKVDELTDAADSGSLNKVLKLYDWLYQEFTVIDTLDTVAYLHYSANVSDSYWSDESVFCDTLRSEAENALCVACQHVLESSCGSGFSNHIGTQAAKYFTDYRQVSDLEDELTQQETGLINQYYKLMDGADSVTYTYDGEPWDMDKWNGTDGDQLYDKDYNAYVEVYYGILKKVNAEVGPIYVQLVQIRDKIAKLEGYDSYTDYAYDKLYCRDYTAADAQTLCEAVKKNVSPAYYGDDIYNSDLWYDYEDVGTDLDSQKLLSLLGQYAPDIDGSVYDAWQYMTQHGLYDIGSGDGRMGNCYTTTLSQYNAPFIYIYTYGDCYDLGDMTHEFGHYVDAYLNPVPNILTAEGNFDLFEIHSNGLEMLYLNYYKNIFGDGADAAEFITLAEQLSGVIDGCVFDEFQRRVYENPDMTLDEINKLYCDICAEYGEYEPYDVDYSWMYVSHNFENPLYYISYAVSSLAALQIWDKAQTDQNAAVATWKDVVSHGAYNEGYLAVLSDCGLRLFTEPGAVDDICSPVLKRLRALSSTQPTDNTNHFITDSEEAF